MKPVHKTVNFSVHVQFIVRCTLSDGFQVIYAPNYLTLHSATEVAINEWCSKWGFFNEFLQTVNLSLESAGRRQLKTY